MKNTEELQDLKDKIKGRLWVCFVLIGLLTFCTFWVWLWYKDVPLVNNSKTMGDAGAFGDAIGGLTAPIINITAAILVYLSFQEQLRANNIQIRNFKKDHLQSQLAFIGPQITELQNEISTIIDKFNFKAILKEKQLNRHTTLSHDRVVESYSENKEYSISVAARVLTPLKKPRFMHYNNEIERWYIYNEKELYNMYLSIEYIVDNLEVIAGLLDVSKTNGYNFYHSRVRNFYKYKLEKQLNHFNKALLKTNNSSYKAFAKDFGIRIDKINKALS